MENSSKELEVENECNNCESCEDDDQRVANRFIGKCEQCTCQSFFDVKWKPCKNHITLIDKIVIDVRREQKDHYDADYCLLHTGIPETLYCTTHTTFVCGESMCFDHKTCNFGYIRDHENRFKARKAFTNITDAEEKIHTEKTITGKTEVELEQFEKEDEAFRGNVINRIDNIISRIDQLAEYNTHTDNKTKTLLKENVCKQLSKDLCILKQAIEAYLDNQNQLCIAKIESKPKMEQIRNRQNGKNMNESKVKCEVLFFSDPKLTAFMDCKTSGTVQLVQSARDVRDMWQTNAETKCQRQVTAEKKVYLLDSKDKETLTKFTQCIASGIKTVFVSSAKECTEDFPIALLCRRETDRAECDIESALVNLPERMFKRTAIINILSVSDKAWLPNVPTAEKVSKFKDIGIILDFAFVGRKKVSSSKLSPCKHTQGRNSKEAFEKFVTDFYKPSTEV